MQFPEQLNPFEDNLCGTAAHSEHGNPTRRVRSEIRMQVGDDVSHGLIFYRKLREASTADVVVATKGWLPTLICLLAPRCAADDCERLSIFEGGNLKSRPVGADDNVVAVRIVSASPAFLFVILVSSIDPDVGIMAAVTLQG